MTDLINHPFIQEIQKFEYIDGGIDVATINGVKEVNSEEGYLYGIIRPLHNQFLLTDLHNHLDAVIKKGNDIAVRSELALLKSKLELIVTERDTDLTINGWQTELSYIDLKDYRNRERYHVLKFFLGVVKVQKHITIQTINEVDQLLKKLNTGSNNDLLVKPVKQEDTLQAEPLQFLLTPTYSKAKNKTVLTDLRNDLIDKGYLSKLDPNNTLANFKRLFTQKDDDSPKGPLNTLRWLGTQTELKYFIYIITNVLIEPNYTAKSNNYVAFKVFMDRDGNPFNPKELRLKEKPATREKMDMLIQSLDLRATSK